MRNLKAPTEGFNIISEDGSHLVFDDEIGSLVADLLL